jgi:CRISPR/Cas system-associated protein Csm6
MSELLFVTVGTTAIGNPRIGDAHLRDIAQQYMKAPDETFAMLHELERKLVAAHSELWKDLKNLDLPPDDFDRTSAELTSTMLLLRQFPSVTTVVFLGSATDEGRLATGINAAVLREIWSRAAVSAQTIPGLEKAFTKVTPAVEKILNDYSAAAAARVSFNITGGFKGVVPSITFLAMQHPGWSIYYQYQGLSVVAEVMFSGAGGPIPAIRESKIVDPADIG